MNPRELLDPTSERRAVARERVPRPEALDGLTIGLLDIAKARGDVFLDRIQEQLEAKGLRCERFIKPTFTKVMPVAMGGEIAGRADVVIEALAD